MHVDVKENICFTRWCNIPYNILLFNSVTVTSSWPTPSHGLLCFSKAVCGIYITSYQIIPISFLYEDTAMAADEICSHFLGSTTTTAKFVMFTSADFRHLEAPQCEVLHFTLGWHCCELKSSKDGAENNSKKSRDCFSQCTNRHRFVQSQKKNQKIYIGRSEKISHRGPTKKIIKWEEGDQNNAIIHLSQPNLRYRHPQLNLLLYTVYIL